MSQSPPRCPAVYPHDPGTHDRERRTYAVVAVTVATMVVELVVGHLSRSLALTTDGWHMGTHAGAVGLAGLAYWFARTWGRGGRFGFGAGKVYALAGYTNAIALGVVGLWLVGEAAQRLVEPAAVRFDEALPVAVLGLVVNLVSAWLLDPHGHHGTSDHNLRAAYLHVVADALTSLFAIVALLGGRLFGWTILDPLMAIAASLLILRWSVGLCVASARQLLDLAATPEVGSAIRRRLERFTDTELLDLHLWELAPGRAGCIVSLIAVEPRPLDEYRAAILEVAAIAHLTVEIDRRPGAPIAARLDR